MEQGIFFEPGEGNDGRRQHMRRRRYALELSKIRQNGVERVEANAGQPFSSKVKP